MDVYPGNRVEKSNPNPILRTVNADRLETNIFLELAITCLCLKLLCTNNQLSVGLMAESNYVIVLESGSNEELYIFKKSENLRIKFSPPC